MTNMSLNSTININSRQDVKENKKGKKDNIPCPVTKKSGSSVAGNPTIRSSDCASTARRGISKKKFFAFIF